MSENENASEKRANIHAGGIVREIECRFASLYWTTLKWIWMTKIHIRAHK